LVSNEPRDHEPSVDRRDSRVVPEHLILERQHTFVDQAVTVVVFAVASLFWTVIRRPVTVVVFAVANFIGRPERPLANDIHAVFGANVFACNALTDARSCTAGLAKLRPSFIHRVVAIVVDAIASLDEGLRLPRIDSLYFLASPIDIAERLRARHLAAAADGEQPRHRRGTKKGKLLNAAGMCSQES
jgi:hypothetical protein